MTPTKATQDWLNRVHHDLVKRVLWAARDCRAMGQAPLPGSLITRCINDEGQSVTVEDCWKSLRLEAPSTLNLTEFESALQSSLAAAARDDVDGVLALEAEFNRLWASAKSSAI